MSVLLVVVKSHLFPQFVQLNREIGTSRAHWAWGDGEFAAVNCGWAGTEPGSYNIHGAAAVKSIAMDRQSIGNEVAAAVTHNSGPK